MKNPSEIKITDKHSEFKLVSINDIKEIGASDEKCVPGFVYNSAVAIGLFDQLLEILISEYVYERIKDRIEVEQVGEIPLKGKCTKLMVYRVLGI